MSNRINKLYRKGIALVVTLSLFLSLFSLYIISAEETEEYNRPWLWPVPGSYQINSLDTYTDGTIHNQGQAIDIGSNGYRGNTRLDVVSSTDGTVHYIQKSYNETTNKGSGWGNYVVVKTADFYIVYAHLQTVTCKYGEIKAGDVIGKMGTTGNSTGVHLHVQAYPVGQSSSSTEIHVFDKFFYNPLYAPHFRFWAGLQSKSVRYGSDIRSYYKNVEETYYVYSGGRELSFEPKSLAATVTAIRIEGTRVYSQPNTSSTVARTIEKGTDIEVFGYYVDAYGKLWYKISPDNETEWVNESEVGFKNYLFNTEITEVVAPEGSYGSLYDLHFDGTLTTRNEIVSVMARIMSNETVISESKIQVANSSYNINNAFFKDLAVDNVANGDYSYELYVTEKASFPGADDLEKTYMIHSSHFIVNSLLSDTVPPLVEDIKIDELSESTVKLSTVATDNLTVSSVKFSFTSLDDSFEKVIDADVNGSNYCINVSPSDLDGSGRYKVIATATDSYGNSDKSEIIVYIPSQAANSELWTVTDASPSLRIRSGPGLSYAKVGSLYNGDKLTITSIVVADGYTWGKFASGWTALDHCTYNSGYLYTLTFNLCGGNAEMADVINKNYGKAVIIPNVTPAKAGFKFLGWSTSPTSSTVAYKPGDTYSVNSSAQLFAVWSDTEKPVISSVTLSNTDWTRDNVVLKIIASDDSGVVFYTFDGGNSWRRADSAVVFENTVFNIGDIGVKDAAGNAVYYNVKLEVSNIDLTPPTMEDVKPVVTVKGSEVTFSFNEADDSISGIHGYKLVYSKSPTLTDPVTVDIKSGDKLQLSDGVYYARLYAYDKAGNSASVSIDRFLVGAASALNSPSSFVVSSTSAAETVLTWYKVDNADGYTVLVSSNSDLSSPLTFTSKTNEIIITTLQSGVIYYATVKATCSDGVYADSDYAQSISFETVSADSTVHSVAAYPDAIISDNSIKVTLNYSETVFNMEVVVNPKATVAYFSDRELTSEITVLNESFTATVRTVFVKVTAENGTSTVYEFTAERASYSAEAPTVILNSGSTSIFVNDNYTSTLTASASDGGTVTTVWYASFNGSEPYVIGEGSAVVFTAVAAGTYEVYAVVTNTNAKCSVTVASTVTKKATVTVSRRTSPISVSVNSKVYDGTSVTPSYSDYVGDGNVKFKYFTDLECEHEILPPVNAGTYYVKAVSEQTDEYESVSSLPCKFTISKAEFTEPPVLDIVMPVLRDRNGYITIQSEGVEFSANGSEWVPVPKGVRLTFNESDVINFRISETDNYTSSDTVTVTITPFSGTDSFIFNGTLSMSETSDGFLIVNEHKLTADELIAGLVKTENVYVTAPDGDELDGYVYTSCIIMIKDEIGIYKSLTVIICGDVDLDGVVTKDDSIAILELSNGVTSSEVETVLVAADVDNDGRITSIDSYKAYVISKN